MLAPPTPASTRERALAAGARTAILVEGWSDRGALQALAARRGDDLEAEGIVVVATGGATNLGPFAAALGPQGLGLRLAGLYDAPERRQLRRGLRRAGLAVDDERDRTDAPIDAAGGARAPVDAAGSVDDLEALGFYACDADLEDELIRALGAAAVERLIEAQGELESYRVFCAQPAQRGRRVDAHLRRFLGTRAGRKIRYGALLVESLPLARVPPPLQRVLAHVRGHPPAAA